MNRCLILILYLASVFYVLIHQERFFLNLKIEHNSDKKIRRKNHQNSCHIKQHLVKINIAVQEIAGFGCSILISKKVKL